MKIKGMASFLTTAALVFTLSAGVAAKASANSPIILGYYTNDSAAALTSYHSYINQISTDTFNTDASGNIVGTIPTQAVNYANSVGILPYALVSNYGATDWDSNAAHQVLTNAAAKQKLIANMVSLVKTNHYKGINVDFESVLASDRNALTSFVKDVASIMKAQGYLTMVSVPAKDTDDPADDWSGAFDYEQLGTYADFIQVMTYDEHGVWADPGSVASKPWMTAALKFSITYVPSEKVIMGIPAYGNDWNLSDKTNSSNKLIPWKDIPQLITSTKGKPTRDNASGSMTFKYTAKDGSKHVVWYEDETSIKTKTHYTLTYELAGVSVYAMGEEDEKFWKAVAAGLK
ncbi:glycosyl hydrolase family 18 protein [Paenibacillus alba]|uniref:Glycosyl hydrolase family 18 protein n=1 Tax=Paenibacillus alba TaxID=1197127 RepID=A0ABU6GBY9_9BACL|nr:glycosyl hydrolase family 18 protein [Paenibacillus alba]MEC0230787.1 glycosyl hydrolase family 18 protein [Paenibacillus alba]